MIARVWRGVVAAEDGDAHAESIDALKRFAGEDYETAVFYAQDERFLVRRELTSTHYEVDTATAPQDGAG
jgi:hypothetical protein